MEILDNYFTICAWVVVLIVSIFTVWGILKICIRIERNKDDDL